MTHEAKNGKGISGRTDAGSSTLAEALVNVSGTRFKAGKNESKNQLLISHRKLKTVHSVSLCLLTPLDCSRPSLGRFGLAKGSNHLHGCIVLWDEKKVAVTTLQLR